MGKVKRRKLRGSRYTPNMCLSKAEEDSLDKYPDINAENMNQNINWPCLVNSSLILSKDNVKERAGLKDVHKKISSTFPDERMTGLNILAALALEEPLIEFIIQSKIISQVAPLLQDPNSQVRLAAAGALRNLCASASDDDVDLIVQQDILPPLAKLLKEYSSNVPPSEQSVLQIPLTYTKGIANSMDENDPCYLIFIHATNLLWNLCECNGEAITMCNQEGLATILLKHINPLTWNYSIAMASADCLLCISENNPRTSSIILPYAESLVTMIDSLSMQNNFTNLHFAVTISGILVNLNYWTPGESSFRQIFIVLGNVLETNALSLLDEHSMNGGIVDKNSGREDLEHIIAAQLLAFEILSNICCSDEDEEGWEADSDEMSNHEEMVITEMETETHKENQNSLPPEVIDGIKYYKLVNKTLQKIEFPREQFLTMSTKNKDICEKSQMLQIRALQCCQNLVSCLDIDDFGGTETLYSIWVQLGKMTLNNSCAEPSLLEASSGTMRAFIDKLASKPCPQLFSISEEDLKHVYEAGTSCVVSAVRANFSRMVGILGCLLIQRTDKKIDSTEPIYSILHSMTEFLLKIAQEDEALWVSAEALDVIIDLYSDDKTDQLAAQISLVEKLKDIHPKFKAKHNRLRKSLGDHRPLVVTVRDNLIAFIKYKGPRTVKLIQQMNKMVL